MAIKATTDTVKTAAEGSTAMAAALKTIGFDSEELMRAAEVLADGEILKSASSLSAQALTEKELVHDRWTEGDINRGITREEIKVGPPQESSGSGAERMVRTYSNPAPQDGHMTQFMRLEEALGSIRGFMRSLNDQHTALAKHQEATTTILSALIGNMGTAKGEPVITDDMSSFATAAAGKSQKYLDAARTALAKAITMKSEIGELEGDARKLRKSEIKAVRAHAADMLIKAREAAFAACAGGADTTLEIRKAISDMLDADPILKGESEEMHDKSKKKEEKAFGKKAMKKSVKKMVAKAMAKAAAKTAAKETPPTADSAAVKGNQADGQDKETGNQDDRSVSTKAQLSTEQAEMLKKAVDGTAMLQGTVNDLISAISGRPVTNGASTPLTLVKSDTNGGSDLLDQLGRVEKAIMAGVLTETDAMRARDLAGKYTAVVEGAFSKSIWASMVMKSTDAVKALFPEARAA